MVLDGTPSPGFRSFLNFLAMFTPAELAAIDALLRTAAERAISANAECTHLSESLPPVVVALHHPLCATQYPASGRGIRLGEREPAVPKSQLAVPRRLHEILAAHRVSLVVSGHLHDAFGPRLHGFHRLHPMRMRSTRHERNRSAHRLLEAEAADWKFRRRFRLMSFADGATSFVDARFVVERDSSQVAAGPAGNGTEPAELPFGTFVCRVEAEDPAARPYPFLIHIVQPPDGRYFPSRSSTTPWRLHRIVVSLVWTHDMRVANTKAHLVTPEEPTKVEAVLTCGSRGAAWQDVVSLEMGKVGRNTTVETSPAHFHAFADIPNGTLTKAEACVAGGGDLSVQVFAEHSRRGRAASDVRPLHFAVDDSSPTLHMGTSLLESFVVRADWPNYLLMLHYASLAVSLALLIMTRMFRDSLADKVAGLAGQASPLSISHVTVQPSSNCTDRVKLVYCVVGKSTCCIHLLVAVILLYRSGAEY
jgi:hypothetical protein